MKDESATMIINHGFFHAEIKADINGQASQQPVVRMVVVRYYLDRPGYDLGNSSSRLWKNPPAMCTPADIASFLSEQGIRGDDTIITDPKNKNNQVLAEVYLDKFGSYMLLEVCAQDGIQFNFTNTTVQDPGILNIRLTDVASAATTFAEAPMVVGAASGRQHCNTSPIGLFAFSMTIALQTADLFGTLVNGTVSESFVLTYGPYAFFLSGLLQFVVGMWEVTRNNIYGATAFSTFGCFWMANGLQLILTTYFPDEINPDLLTTPDPVGNFILNLWVLGFICVLLKQTLVMNKLSTILIALLIVNVTAGAISGWSVAVEWIVMITGLFVSVFAFYVFAAEFTNEVYHRQVINMHSWSEGSPEEIFGAPGRVNKLQVKAIDLRKAHLGAGSGNTVSGNTVHSVRAVRRT